MKTSTKLPVAFYLLFTLFIFSNCAEHMYTTSPVASATNYAAALTKAQKKHRYMLLQSGVNLYTIKYAEVDKAKINVTVTLDKPDSIRFSNMTGSDLALYNPPKGSQKVERQLHIFLVDSTSYTYDEPHTIPLQKIRKMQTVD